MTTWFPCALWRAAIEYVFQHLMPDVSAFSARRSVRTAIAVLAVALILVPTIKRAQQHVERRDATRLSIKHSWIGVVPPTRATIAPQSIDVALPQLVATAEPAQAVKRDHVVVALALHPVLDLSPEPLRGPPSVSLS
jgi:hypothetical protein